jgi:hypothetical protein
MGRVKNTVLQEFTKPHPKKVGFFISCIFTTGIDKRNISGTIRVLVD